MKGTNLDTFKIKPGRYKPHTLNRENFEKYTRKEHNVYVQIGKDGEKRYFGVCPWCDNPIQFIGLYKKVKGISKPYGKHYCRSVKGIASHNQQAYELCPKASHNYSPPEKGDKKTEMTAYEVEIYNTVREHFDQIIYLIKEETGLVIDTTLARKLIRSYSAAEGWMYKWATLYNIPWMMLYLYDGFDVYGMLVKKGSSLSEYLQTNCQYKLKEFIIKENGEEKRTNYYSIKTTTWTESNLMAANHKRKSGKDNSVDETIELSLAIKKFSTDDENQWEQVWSKELVINEVRFPRLITSSSRNKYRNQALIDLAKNEMPEIEL